MVVLVFVLSITIIGRPVTQGQYKGDDFFIVDYSNADDLGGFWYKDGKMTGFATMTKEKAEEMHRKWKLEKRKTKVEI